MPESSDGGLNAEGANGETISSEERNAEKSSLSAPRRSALARPCLSKLSSVFVPMQASLTIRPTLLASNRMPRRLGTSCPLAATMAATGCRQTGFDGCKRGRPQASLIRNWHRWDCSVALPSRLLYQRHIQCVSSCNPLEGSDKRLCKNAQLLPRRPSSSLLRTSSSPSANTRCYRPRSVLLTC